MGEFENAMALFKELPRKNCRECLVPTCLAFAAAIFRGERRIEDCPYVEEDLVRRFHASRPTSTSLENETDRSLDPLRRKIAKIDLVKAAPRLDATLSDGMLKINSLGKDFFVDSKGRITSACHVHTWVTIPLLHYVIHCKGIPVSGNWIPFRELEGGAPREELFKRRCETTLRRVADEHTDLFADMIEIFNARPAPTMFSSDIAVTLHPLPRVPVLICYWKPEDGMESTVNIFFDDTAGDNLPIEALYTLVTGMVIMFEKIAITHTERIP